MSWSGPLLLAPFVLALVVLALPFHGGVRGRVVEGELTGVVQIAWAFGLLSAELVGDLAWLRVAGLRLVRLRRGRGRPRRRDRLPREGAGRAVAKARSGARSMGTLLRLAARLARTLHLRLWLRGRVGTGDPGDTAALAGLVRAARELPGVDAELEVDWLDEVLEVEGEGSARVWAPELLAVAGLLLARRENRAAVWALMR